MATTGVQFSVRRSVSTSIATRQITGTVRSARFSV